MSNPWDAFDDENKEKENKINKNIKNNEKKGNSSNFFENIFFTENNKGKSNKQAKNDNNGVFDIFGIIENFLNNFKNNLNNFKVFLLVVFGLFCLWLISGFYIVRQEENAIVMRFGKYVRDVESGLHYHIPYPIEEVVKEATTRVRVLKIGGEDSSTKLGEGWALTGDENIVNIELNVQWKIENLKKFIFSVRDKQQTIYDATQSAIREVISKRKLASILTSGRGEIEEESKQLLQQMLNSYDMGVSILLVQMLKIDPPAQVIDSFRDVQTARVDKESEINKAYKYKNDILPKVRGEAGKILEDARGYAISVVNRAKGDASRFNQVYEQYKNAPFVTRKRIYLDAMEDLFQKNKITIIDENVKNVFLSNTESDKKYQYSSQKNIEENKIETDDNNQ